MAIIISTKARATAQNPNPEWHYFCFPDDANLALVTAAIHKRLGAHRQYVYCEEHEVPEGVTIVDISRAEVSPWGTPAPAQPAAQQGAADEFFLLLPQRPKPEAPAGTVDLDWDAYSGAQMLAFGRASSDAAIAALRASHGQAPVAFLKSVIALCSNRGYSPANIEAWDKDAKWIADLWRQAESMLAASPTPPAEQQAQREARAAPGELAESAAKGAIMGAAYDFRDAHISGSMNLKRSAHAILEAAVDSALAAPQQEAQEPTEIPEAIERMAADRYKVVPSREGMFHRWAVVAGTGTQQLYVGREVECHNMARKFAGAFLDGAFVAMQHATPQPAPDCHHRPPCDECAALAAQGGK